MNRALILMYHIIGKPYAASEAKYCCYPNRFARQMAWLAKKYNPVGLDTLLAGMNGSAGFIDNAVAVTFDDGFANTFENAMPVLERLSIPATMFVVANRLGGSNDWMHKRGMPKRQLLDVGQIREMRDAGITIGSHTLSHPRLPECKSAQMSREIIDSKAKLESILSEPVLHFCYPYGLYNEVSRELVEKSGYSSACSTRSGFNNAKVDRFELRRIEVFGSDRRWHLKQKLKFGINEASLVKPMEYYLQRARSRFSGMD